MDNSNSKLEERFNFVQLKAKFNTFRASFQAKYPKVARGLMYAGWTAMAGFGSLLFFCSLIYFGAFGSLPSKTALKAIQNNTAAEVYSADGQILGKYYVENRINVAYEDISPNLINALIATEDSRFFDHKGVDLRAWVRVLLRTVLLRDQSGGGGSTLSQQLAKNLFPRKKHFMLSTPINKVKEMFIARRLEKVYTKEELLSLYLNTVPFGGNVFGISVASKRLFNTTPKEIKTEEAAVLIGMLKANTSYHPVLHPKRALRRRNTVLNQMQKYEYLKPEVCDSLKKTELILSYTKESSNDGVATYFREHLRQQLAEKVKTYKKSDGTSYNLYTDGLKIYTSIHAKMQRYAEEAMAEQMSRLQKDFDQHWRKSKKKPWGSQKNLEKEMRKSERYLTLQKQGVSAEAIEENFQQEINMRVFSWDGEGIEKKTMSPLDSIKYYYCMLNAGFLVMEPETGYILAWVGGINHQYFQYDHIKSQRQVGSTFKPIVYASALNKGIFPCDYINNRLVSYTDYDDWQPRNSDGKYGGAFSMEGALSKSVNSVTVDLMMRVGVDDVRSLAQKMGVSTNIPKVPAIALGAVDVSLLDMVKVYSTFANRGIPTIPNYLTRIETADGEVLEEFPVTPLEESRRVLSEDYSDMMIQMLESVVDSGTAKRLRYQYHFNGEIAGKTGTTQNNSDGWFLGFTPDLVAGAWVGGQTPNVRFRSTRLGQGANTALPIWARFMKKVYKDKELSRYFNNSFEPQSEKVAALMNCPPFLLEEPTLAAFEEDDDGEEAI
ncbi:MAG: penicillin-binding protein 1A, partial [Saprospiraceae bacterium]